MTVHDRVDELMETLHDYQLSMYDRVKKAQEQVLGLRNAIGPDPRVEALCWKSTRSIRRSFVRH